MTWCTAPRRAYPPRSSRRARARPRAATWAPSSEERWCPSSTAPSSARRPRSAACHMRGVCMVYVPLRGRAESPTPQPLTDCSPSTRAGLAPSADPSKRSLGTTSCRLSSGQRRARDPRVRGRLGIWAPSTCGRRQLRTLHVSSLHARRGAERKTFSFRSFIYYKAYRGPKAALHPGPTSEGDPTAKHARNALSRAGGGTTHNLVFVCKRPSSLLAWLPLPTQTNFSGLMTPTPLKSDLVF